MEKFQIFQALQKYDKRHDMSVCCYKSSDNILGGCMIATTFNVKHKMSVNSSEAKTIEWGMPVLPNIVHKINAYWVKRLRLFWWMLTGHRINF